MLKYQGFFFFYIWLCFLPMMTKPPSTSFSDVDFFESFRSPRKLSMIILCHRRNRWFDQQSLMGAASSLLTKFHLTVFKKTRNIQSVSVQRQNRSDMSLQLTNLKAIWHYSGQKATFISVTTIKNRLLTRGLTTRRCFSVQYDTLKCPAFSKELF